MYFSDCTCLIKIFASNSKFKKNIDLIHDLTILPLKLLQLNIYIYILSVHIFL